MLGSDTSRLRTIFEQLIESVTAVSRWRSEEDPNRLKGKQTLSVEHPGLIEQRGYWQADSGTKDRGPPSVV